MPLYQSVPEAPFEPVGRGGVPLDQLIEDQVAEVHGDVDEVLHRMQETDEYKLPEPKEEEHHRHKEDRKGVLLSGDVGLLT